MNFNRNDALLQQQLLYEYWLKRDTWLLRDEAVPLLAGLDPASTDPGGADIAGLREAVMSSVEDGSLGVYNRQGPAESWSVAPAAIYRWAVGRGISLPEPFTALMEFILQAVKREDAARLTGEDEGLSFNAENELILGAALAVTCAFPEECRGRQGRIDIRSIIILMDRHSDSLLDREELGFSYERVYDLLKNWTDKLR